MNRELPAMAASSYVSSTSTAGDFFAQLAQQNIQGGGLNVAGSPLQSNLGGLGRCVPNHLIPDYTTAWDTQGIADITAAEIKRVKDQLVAAQAAPTTTKPKKQEKNVMAADTRRLVQVFLADPDAKVPLDHAIIFHGEQKLTDLSDQELFFELDVKGLLEAHNAYRESTVDKSVKTKTTYLEPIRVRDLKMTVVTIASF